MFLKAANISIAILLAGLVSGSCAIAGFTLKPALSLSEVYDSNPGLLQSNTGGNGTFKSTVQPSLNFSSTGKAYSLTGTYIMTSLFHHNDSSLDYEIHNANLGASFIATQRTSFTLADSYTLNKGIQTTSSGGVGVHTGRSPIMHNTVSAGASTQYNNFWRFNLNLSESKTEYDDPALIDTVTDSATLGLNYNLNKKTGISSSYTFSDFTFDTSNKSTSRESHNLTLGVNRSFTPVLTGTFSAGVLYSNGFTDSINWSFGASLSRKSKMLDASISLDRNINDSSGLTDNILINNTLTLSGRYYMKQNTTFNASSTLSQLRSESGAAVDITTLNTELGCTYLVNSNLDLNMKITRYNQWVDSSAATSLVRDQVSIGITYRPTEWRL